MTAGPRDAQHDNAAAGQAAGGQWVSRELDISTIAAGSISSPKVPGQAKQLPKLRTVLLLFSLNIENIENESVRFIKFPVSFTPKKVFSGFDVFEGKKYENLRH